MYNLFRHIHLHCTLSVYICWKSSGYISLGNIFSCSAHWYWYWNSCLGERSTFCFCKIFQNHISVILKWQDFVYCYKNNFICLFSLLSNVGDCKRLHIFSPRLCWWRYLEFGILWRYLDPWVWNISLTEVKVWHSYWHGTRHLKVQKH